MREVIAFYFILLEILYVLSPYSTTEIGSVVISPSPRATVCQAGDRLQVTCNSTESALRWTLTLLGMIDPVQISISSTTVVVQRTIINSSRITVSRASERGTLPLTSKLVISSVSESLNGTLNITCMEFGTSSMAATTTVYIAGNIQGSFHPRSPVVEIEEILGTESVSVSLQWIQEIHEGLLVSYNISIPPVVGVMTTMISNMKVNVSVAYNTPYNVSVVADVCGQRNSTTYIELNYVSSMVDPLLASCDQPLPPTGGYIITNNTGTSTIKGATVTFVCPGNHEKTAVCTDTGQWEPNSSSICEETTKTSECLSQDGKIAVASSVTVFTVASILFFIAGFLSGKIYQKKRKVTSEMVSSSGQIQNPDYDDVVLQECDEHNLELKENIAYAPIQ